MKNSKPSADRLQRLRKQRARQGAIAALFAAFLPIAIIMACYAINIVYMELVRTELQITMDLSTRAAGRTLAVTGSTTQATEAAEAIMAKNSFGNKKLNLASSKIDFGVSTRNSKGARFVFGDGPDPNAVRIAANGKMSVPPLFPTLGVPVNFRPIKTAICTQIEMDIALVLDRSGSMAFRANEPTGYIPSNAPPGWRFGMRVPNGARWLDANDAVHRFLGLMNSTKQDELISLSTYNHKAYLDVPLTSNYQEIVAKMESHSAKYEGGATNIGGGMRAALASMADTKRARPWAARVMIVLTDGNHNEGTDPIQVAYEAAAQKINIFTITFSQEADQDRMKQVADIGSGRHIHAVSGKQLIQAFEDIARSLPTLITY